ncbi:MAG: DUF882 domain-containing protein [Nitrospirae bacterium]|nr:DUF882 domain-containing protein [Nitrospirota bacterium]
MWTRRSFLKASMVGAVALLGRPGFARGAAGSERPEGALSLHNVHTGEALEVTYRDPSGQYVPEALAGINHLLRCHYTGQVMDIDLGVIEFLNAVDKRLGGGHEIQVISGYRSPEYNELLIRQGRDVAKHSFPRLRTGPVLVECGGRTRTFCARVQ